VVTYFREIIAAHGGGHGKGFPALSYPEYLVFAYSELNSAARDVLISLEQAGCIIANLSLNV
jgi:hypothetical protein